MRFSQIPLQASNKTHTGNAMMLVRHCNPPVPLQLCSCMSNNDATGSSGNQSICSNMALTKLKFGSNQWMMSLWFFSKSEEKCLSRLIVIMSFMIDISGQTLLLHSGHSIVDKNSKIYFFYILQLLIKIISRAFDNRFSSNEMFGLKQKKN